jgi:eukaryotic-like serine/threonine-protein kinase
MRRRTDLLLRWLRYLVLTLVLLLVFMASALVAMRFAIQGREVRVPSLNGLTAADAERSANAAGLVLSVESRFYSPAPPGRIVSQTPEAGARVRRGWKIVAAESLGPQRVAVPNVIGQSQRAAEINITRRGLEIGSIATMHLPGAQPGTVLAQSPAADNREVSSPKISLLVVAAANAQTYIMPNFTGKSLKEATSALQDAGLGVGRVRGMAGASSQRAPGRILRQYPPAGQKVAAGTMVNFDVGP